MKITLTMDCETVQKRGVYPAGPESWWDSGINIWNFVDIVEFYGYTATFYVTPEAAEAHTDTFRALSEHGHKVGLHLHPQTYRNGIDSNLGGLSYDTQYQLIANAYHDFKAALGFAPIHFRPGCFSHNTDTIRVINHFRMQGSWERSAVRVSRLKYMRHCLSVILALLCDGDLYNAACRFKHAFTAPPDLDFVIDGWEWHTLKEIVDTGANLTLLTHNYMDYTDGRKKKLLVKLLEYLKWTNSKT